MATDQKAPDTERQEHTALARAKRQAPEQNLSMAVLGRDVGAHARQGTGTAPEDSTPEDWLVADAARRDFDDETADGLSTLEEAVRQTAEELPIGETWEQRVRAKAHELWESEGGPHGRAEDHWRIAAALVAEEIASSRNDLPYRGELEKSSQDGTLLENLGEFPNLSDQGRDDA